MSIPKSSDRRLSDVPPPPPYEDEPPPEPPHAVIGPNQAQVLKGTSGGAPLPPLKPERAVSSSAAEAQQNRDSRSGTLLPPVEIGPGRSASASGKDGFLRGATRRLTRALTPSRAKDASSNLPQNDDSDPSISDRESLSTNSPRPSDPKALPRSSPRASEPRSGNSKPAPLELREALMSQEARQALLAFMQSEYTTENFEFLTQCASCAAAIANEERRDQHGNVLTPQQQRAENHEALRFIVDKFIRPSGERQVNLNDRCPLLIQAAWAEVDAQPAADRNYIPLFLQLDDAVDQILKLVAEDTWKRHKASQESKGPAVVESAWDKMANTLKKIVPSTSNSSSKPQVARWPVYFASPELVAQYKRASSTQSSTEGKYGRDAKWEREEAIKQADLTLAQSLVDDLHLDESPAAGPFAPASAASSSVGSSSSPTHRQYGNKLAFLLCCEAFLAPDTTIEEKKAHLGEIVRHLDSETSAREFVINVLSAKTLREQYAIWEKGTKPKAQQMGEIERLVLQLQNLAF